MELTHQECGISVISGPWGIGKTTAIDAFAGRHECECAVVKVEPGATKRGATAGGVMQRVVEELRRLHDRPLGTQLSNATWTLRSMIFSLLSELFLYNAYDAEAWPNPPRFTFIFDEAQYLSKEAIDLLRFWNDHDRTTTPFPVGLIFVGNNEFALAESLGGESVLSGAVRSRLLFEVPLAYTHINDTDLTLFAQSRGVTDAGALREFVAYFSQARIKRDLRQAERLLDICRREAPEGKVTADVVRELLPA
ncbi:MAG TPA: ATP-binding protein [Allosphingosinicella sp.]